MSTLTYNTNADFMHKFEQYAQGNSFEISLLLMLSERDGIPTHVRQQWLRSFHALSRRHKVGSLQRIIQNTCSLQQSLFHSRDEFKKAAHFILSDLIPLIIDYEVQDEDLLDEIVHVYHQRMQQHQNFSVFTVLGNIELVLFAAVHLLTLLHILFPSHPYTTLIAAHYFPMKTWLVSALLVIFVIHIFAAIKTFHQRRIFCYYLQCLSPKLHANSFKYTAYILEGFNICNLSDLLNSDYLQSTELKLISPNEITTYDLVVLSLKYIVGIAYCLGTFGQNLGLFTIAAAPVILGALCNLDSINSWIYKSLYADIVRLYQQSASSDDRSSNNSNSDDTDDDNQDALSHSVSRLLRNTRRQNKYRYFRQRIGYLCGYAVLLSCVWPIVLLTPFFFAACVLCDVDPGLQMDWRGRQFARYWSAFMAIKVIAGLTFITVADLVMNSRLVSACSSSNNHRNSNVDGDAPFDISADAYNTMLFAGMNAISIGVIIALVCGLESDVMHIHRMFAWCMVYIWLTGFAVKHIVPERQRVANWKAVMKMKWIFSSHLFQTRLQ